MQNKWMRYLKGCIEVRLYGDYVERLFNMCRTHEIELWNIKRDETSFYCCMAGEDFKRMHPFLRKTGTRVRVLHKIGFPFYVPFLKKRILFFMGVFACLFMLNWMTRYIWAIEYVGNVQISNDELTDFLRKEGIHYGMKKSTLDCDAEEKQLRSAFPVVTWTSVYFEGTKLYVEIKENDRKDIISQSTQGMDMIATESGTISSIVTRNGIPMVKAGDTVEKGQVLVAGAVPVYDEAQNIINYQIYEADADITIQTVINYKEQLSELYPVIIYPRSSKKGFFIEASGFHVETPILIQEDKTYEVVSEKKQLRLLGQIYLPFYYGTIKKQEYQVQYRNYGKEQMKELLTDSLDKFILCLQEKGVQIIEKNVKMVENRKGMEIDADLLVIKPTGEKTSLEE